jgi:hypothetical protein
MRMKERSHNHRGKEKGDVRTERKEMWGYPLKGVPVKRKYFSIKNLALPGSPEKVYSHLVRIGFRSTLR